MGKMEDPFENVPGKWVVELLVFEEGDEEYDQPFIAGGKPRSAMGFTLRELRTLLGGDEGYIENSFIAGKSHFVSVAQWKDADPDSTKVYTHYRFVPDPGHEEEVQAGSAVFHRLMLSEPEDTETSSEG